jgi:hypothetical protein
VPYVFYDVWNAASSMSSPDTQELFDELAGIYNVDLRTYVEAPVARAQEVDAKREDKKARRKAAKKAAVMAAVTAKANKPADVVFFFKAMQPDPDDVHPGARRSARIRDQRPTFDTPAETAAKEAFAEAVRRSIVEGEG